MSHAPTRVAGVAIPALMALAAALPSASAQTRAAISTLVAQTRRTPDAPAIDGRLDDAAWQAADAIAEFRQKEPREGAPATEPTAVRIVYDQSHLYIGVELFDSDPSQIRASELRRDNTLEADDTFAVLLDTYQDHRNAFLFRVNARGTRYDGLIRNESRFISSDWDEQWTAAAQLTPTGWTAEFAIPFKILRFSGAPEQVWGANFERVIKRKNELVYWSGWDRNFGFHHVSQAGRLAGISGIRQAERLRIRPYVIAGAEKLDAVPAPSDMMMRREIGIDDLKFAVTSNLISDLSVNPDFAQTEVDAQRVNLTRFSLFFPEKRQFFIEGADSLRMGVGLLHFGPPPLELFHSRMIGLSSTAEPIPVIAGGKLTGKAAGFDLGLINVQTDGWRGQPGENFTVGRVRKEVLERSYIGAIVTNRQGGGRANRVAGADARFVFRKYLNVTGLFATSTETSRERRWARQAGIEWRDDFIEAGVNYIGIDPGFNPGIGFVRRHDRMIGTRVSVKPRPGGRIVRQLELTPTVVYFHEPGGVVQTRQYRFQFATAFQTGDRVEIYAENDVDRVKQPFRIGPGVTLPPALYEWNTAGVTLRTFNGRRISAAVNVDRGNFYDGTKRGYDLSGEIRPSKNLSFNPSYGFNDVDLREGSFRTHLFGLRANVSFTTTVLTSAFLQYNSSGDLAALQLRLNYIFRTIDNLYLVYNETRFTAGPWADRSNRSFVVKTTYSLHR